MPAVGLGGADQFARAGVLLHPLAPGELFHPAQVVLPAFPVHPGEIAARIGGEHRRGHVRALQELFRVELGKEPQRAEELLQPPGAAVELGGVGHLAADPGKRLQTGRAQADGKEGELRPAQHGDGLKAVEKLPAARLRDLAQPRAQQRPAERENHQPLLTQPQPLCRPQRALGLERLPPRQIPVVEQPFTGRGDVRGIAVAAAHGVVAAPDLPGVQAQGARGRAPAALPQRAQQTRDGGRVVAQPLGFDIEGEILIHGDLLNEVFTPYFFRRRVFYTFAGACPENEGAASRLRPGSKRIPTPRRSARRQKTAPPQRCYESAVKKKHLTDGAKACILCEAEKLDRRVAV